MSPVSYQTIRLSKGKHTSPLHGACVMELASMLAGEPFTDHPASVCPVIGSLLRAYNDSIDDTRRQDLYAYASTVVGTRASKAVQDARAARLAAWASERYEQRRLRFLSPARLIKIRLAGASATAPTGADAVRAISKHTDDTHAQVLALIAELVAINASAVVPATHVTMVGAAGSRTTDRASSVPCGE